MNYFSCLCFAWSIVGIVTRILMTVYGEKWNKWEMDHAYKEEKPKWIYFLSLGGVFLVLFTWYQVFILTIEYSWIIASILSLTLIKISALLFNYEKFRKFASETLNDPKKRIKLNVSVFIVSMLMILLGIFVY